MRARQSSNDIRMPGVQKPHCRRVMAAERLLQRESAPSRRQALDCVEAAPSACTASIRQERTGDAVDLYRARAADAVLAADMGAGRAQLMTQEIASAACAARLRRCDRAAVEREDARGARSPDVQTCRHLLPPRSRARPSWRTSCAAIAGAGVQRRRCAPSSQAKSSSASSSSSPSSAAIARHRPVRDTADGEPDAFRRRPPPRTATIAKSPWRRPIRGTRSRSPARAAGNSPPRSFRPAARAVVNMPVKKFLGLQDALLRAERSVTSPPSADQHQRQLRARIGMGDRAAHGAAVAGLEWPIRERRASSGTSSRSRAPLDAALRGGRADNQPALVSTRSRQFGHAA